MHILKTVLILDIKPIQLPATLQSLIISNRIYSYMLQENIKFQLQGREAHGR